MPRSTRSLIAMVSITAAAILLGFAYLLTFPGRDTMWDLPRFHFYVLTPTLFALAISAIAVGWTGLRLRDMSVLMLALAIFSLNGFFLIHALSTPGFLVHDPYHLAGVASQIGMTSCAIWIYLSTLSSDHAFMRMVSKHRKRIVAGWVAFIVLLNIASLAYPDISEFVPIHITPINYLMALITGLLYFWAAKRYFQQFRLVQFPLHAAIVFGSVLLMITELVMVTTMMWTLAWWLYHIVLAVSALMLLYGVIAQYRSNISITHALRQANRQPSSDPLRVFISGSMHNLIVATETKDEYTAGHNYRVAMYGLQLARAMNLDTEQMRALARGGLIHDVGKIRIPSEILNKPGKLDTHERTVIEQHPVIGYEMCKYIGFMTEELSVIRHHHEKWDGTGYPDKLRGEEISLLARILAVADVYDALTSRRAYRDPWPQERALKAIVEGSGTHFDPECVAAFAGLCNRGELIDPEASGQPYGRAI
ncbi:HD-GYP domain-containing protein [Cohnella thailandensis]|uniref:HD-GYP domain-containing protein n=1 Tax=Cohnella thailandensis TaxID=557557 RepID=A0A841SVL3_9BACL|nr:HD-GYP domain-containing protein [Cohnella thailandensis]MBB6634228.1 HD-GYP domain-containing protein [Cohnella thailandensis]MBP1972274.1 putative nucleotidyltransferase with HDIG domain [Cohnella thailandensis]